MTALYALRARAHAESDNPRKAATPASTQCVARREVRTSRYGINGSTRATRQPRPRKLPQDEPEPKVMTVRPKRGRPQAM